MNIRAPFITLLFTLNVFSISTFAEDAPVFLLEKSYSADYNDVWQKVVQVVTVDLNLPIKTIDKDSGILMTEMVTFQGAGTAFSGASDFVRKIAKVKTGMFEPAFRDGRYRLSVFVSKKGTDVIVKPVYTIELWADGGYISTESTGYLESQILGKIF